MTERLFDVDRFSGIIETFQMVDGKPVIRKIQNYNAILDANKREMQDNIGSNFTKDMHKMASIPMNVVNEWREELKKAGNPDVNPLSNNNRVFLVAKLNSKDYEYLRTKQGRI